MQIDTPIPCVSRVLPEAQLPDGELPIDFLDRVVILPSASIMRVPVRLRGLLAATMSATLSGMARGIERASVLEQARTKLLLCPVPRFRNKRSELKNRFDAWEAGPFEALLIRIEEQHFERKQARKKNRKPIVRRVKHAGPKN